MELITNDEKLFDELLLVVKLFYSENDIDNMPLTIVHKYTLKGTKLTNHIKINGLFDKKHKRIDNLTNFQLGEKRYKFLKRFAKLSLYEALSLALNKSLPWGALTGIRPTKLLGELCHTYGNLDDATKHLIDDFYVRADKAMLAKEILLTQGKHIKDDKIVDLYVHIPFCPTRCSYCSFISNGLDMCNHLLEPYLQALYKDITQTKKFLYDAGYVIKTVYIGGGTPTVLSATQLNDLLTCIGIQGCEFTVESGRPDTFSKDKLDVMKKFGVTRICINPQSFNDTTLANIGRNHTSQQILDAYNLALPYGFDINMDLIAGLDGEDLEVFKYSLNKALSLNPANITVHTLSIKRASKLHQFGGETSSATQTDQMLDYATNTLMDAGYKPYYLYRQKNMIGNLENIGFARDGKVNVFNIDSMEEIASIVACGAGAVSKRYYSQTDRIERFGELKNIKEYCARIDEMIAKKIELFQN